MSGRKKIVVAMTILYSLSTAGALGGIVLQAVNDNKSGSTLPIDTSNIVQLETQSTTVSVALETKGVPSAMHQEQTRPRKTQGETQTRTKAVTQATTVASTKASKEAKTEVTTKASKEATTEARTNASKEATTAATAQTKAVTEPTTTAAAQTKELKISDDAIGIAVANKGSVTIRKEASKDSELVGWVGKDATCEVLGKVQNGWVKIRHNNKVGYVDASYLTITNK